MKILKYLTAVLLLLCLCRTAASEERRKPLNLEEMKIPYSKFYTPHPYPKTKEEMNANIVAQVRNLNALQKERRRATSDFWSEIKDFIENLKSQIKKTPSTSSLIDIVQGKTSYKIGKIIKVKNRMAHKPHAYSWLILILNKDDDIVFRIKMEATGIFMGAAHYKFSSSQKDTAQLLRTEKDMLHILAATIGKAAADIKVKKMERVAFNSRIAPSSAPPVGNRIG